MYKNSEGYADPTAGAAMSQIMKEYKQKQKKLYAEKNRRKVYVVSAYAGDVDANTAKAVEYCRMVIDAGYMPLASHLLYPQMLNDKIPAERELGLMFGLALLHMCDEVWVFGPVSSGMAQEIEEAKRLKKKLVYKEVRE
nr:MAG TPA: N-deoxyribosyltransferase [Caudoviricetes sp.]